MVVNAVSGVGARRILIVTAATAHVTKSTGEVVILIFNLFLWFGSKMPHTLFNPNQLLHFGVIVSDDPTDHD